MKLYYLQPIGNGPTSYFVLANTAVEAAAAINAARRKYALEHCAGHFQDDWGGDGAVAADQLAVAVAGQVLTNDNN